MGAGPIGCFVTSTQEVESYLSRIQVSTGPGAVKIIDVGLAKIYDFLVPSTMSVEGRLRGSWVSLVLLFYVVASFGKLIIR